MINNETKKSTKNIFADNYSKIWVANQRTKEKSVA